MSEPLLSVVIPTRNRADYLVHALRAVASIPGDELEIVVQDNSDDDRLGPILAGLGDPRVSYEHRGGALSVIDNFTLAMRRVRGEYACMIGDDDAVTTSILPVAQWAAAHGIDAVTPARIAWYVWPDVQFRHYGGAYAGTLTMRPFTGRVVERDPAEGVRRSLHDACQDIVDTVGLPKLYAGLVHRRCLEAMMSEAGTLFPGVSPDMSSAMGLSKYVRRMVSLDYPVILGGSSAPSTAGASARKEHVGRLEDQPHLPRGCAAAWPVEVPAVFAVQTVWAQSALAALRATGRESLARRLDLGLLHAMCGILNDGYWKVTWESYWRAVAATGRSRPGALANLTVGIARTWWLRARHLGGRLLRSPMYVGAHTTHGLATVADAAVELERWAREQGIRPLLERTPRTTALDTDRGAPVS